jgi:hypothetical protein
LRVEAYGIILEVGWYHHEGNCLVIMVVPFYRQIERELKKMKSGGEKWKLSAVTQYGGKLGG